MVMNKTKFFTKRSFVLISVKMNKTRSVGKMVKITGTPMLLTRVTR